VPAFLVRDLLRLVASRLSTSDVTTAAKATPMTNATARSTMFP